MLRSNYQTMIGQVRSQMEPNPSSAKIPPTWAWARLGEIVELKYGEGLPRRKRAPNGSVPVYGSNGLVGHHDRAITRGPTIVIGRKGSVGAVNRSEIPCWPIDTTYYADEFPRGVSMDYLFHFLSSRSLGNLDKSTAIPGINRDDVYATAVPLPPFPEQGRISLKLVQILQELKEAREALRAGLERIKSLEQSTLNAAFGGHLAPQDPT